MCYAAPAVNTALQMEGIMSRDLKQIGPRIREDIALALKEHSRNTRMSVSLLVERAVAAMLDEAGVDLDYDWN